MVDSPVVTLEADMTEVEQMLLSRVRSYDRLPQYVQKIPLAIKVAKEAHKGQKRASGEDFFSHPLSVANILAAMSMDSITIIVALLHDVVEDTKVSIKRVQKLFGLPVASVVDGLTKLTEIEDRSDTVVQAENFRKLIVAISEDIRVLIIKLADRLHNMQTLSHLPSNEKRKKIARETMEIYAPLAERIGMHAIKNELQDLAFAELYPEIRESIFVRLNLLRGKGGIKLVQKITDSLGKLMEENYIEAQIFGREKTPYSIWEKMKRKNISFEQLSDVMAFRIIVRDLQDCYRALGVIHSNYHMIPGRFKDFISLPRKNRYRSLHTVVMGPEEQRIEIQIRTLEMQNIAENGIAVHWSYKQSYEATDKEEYNWIKELIEISESATDSIELLENTKLEMYEDQVFCFTPGGQVIALPKGASAIDFAYAVHSDIGNFCVSAKINHKLSPLRTKLQNGDQVEIITEKNHKPLPSWEKFVVTGKALSEIRKSIRQEKSIEYSNLGRALLLQAFKKQGQKLIDTELSPILSFFGKSDVNDLLCSIGEGHLSPDTIIKQISPKKKFNFMDTFSFLRFIRKRDTFDDKSIPIKGLTPGVAVHFASCCSPIPGDHIVGIRVAGKGIEVHISDCENLQNYIDDPNRWIDLSWDKNITKKFYVGTINMVIQNTPGAFATMAVEIAKNDANISNLKINSRAPDFFELTADIEVKGANHLTNIVSTLRSQECIHSVGRVNK